MHYFVTYVRYIKWIMPHFVFVQSKGTILLFNSELFLHYSSSNRLPCSQKYEMKCKLYMKSLLLVFSTNKLAHYVTYNIHSSKILLPQLYNHIIILYSATVETKWKVFLPQSLLLTISEFLYEFTTRNFSHSLNYNQCPRLCRFFVAEFYYFVGNYSAGVWFASR